MNRTVQRWKVALALLMIFASGIGLGWFVHAARMIQTALPQQANDPESAARHWTEGAMKTLSRELKLTPEQESAIRPLLQDASGKMELDRERVLFQLHLQVLKVHDDMRSHLRPDQLPALGAMRLRLQQDIKRRFAALLDDPATPPP